MDGSKKGFSMTKSLDIHQHSTAPADNMRQDHSSLRNRSAVSSGCEEQPVTNVLE